MPRRMEVMIPCYYYDFGALPAVPVYLRAPVADVDAIAPLQVSENLGYVGHAESEVYSAYPDFPPSTNVPLYRDFLAPYGTTPAPAGEILAASAGLGNIALTLPIGPDDFLVMGTAAVARVTAGVMAWKVTLSPYPGYGPVTIALRGTEAMFVYRVGSISNFSGQLRYFTTPITRSSGTTNPTGWSAYDYTIGGSVQPYNVNDPEKIILGIEAVVMAWPDFEIATSACAELSGDGFQPFWVMAFEGPAIDAGGGRKACSGAGCVLDAEFEYTIGQINVEVGAAGASLNYLQFTYTPLLTWAGIQSLVPLPAGYDSYNKQSVNVGWAHYTVAPSVPTEFWEDRVRAIEII